MISLLACASRRIRERIGDLWWYTLIVFVLNRMGDAVNIFIGMWLVLKLLPGTELGALMPLMSVGILYTIPLGVLLLPVPKYISLLLVKGEEGQARALLRDSVWVSLAFAVFMLLAILWTGDAIMLRLRVSDHRMLWVIAGFAALSAITPIVSSAQQTLKCFDSMVWAGIFSPYLRLAGMLLLLPAFGVLGYLVVQFGMALFGCLVAGVAVYRATCRMPPAASYRPLLRAMASYAMPLVLSMAVARIQAPVEAVVFRHRLPNEVSAAYLVVMMFGAIPTYIGAAVMPFLWVHVSELFEKGLETRHLLLQSLAFNFIIGGGAAIATALLAPVVFNLPGPWRAHAAFAGYVGPVCALNVVRMGIGLFASHEVACRRFAYMWYAIPLSLLCTCLLWVLPAWQVARPYLPAQLWLWVNGWSQPRLGLFIGVMLVTSAVTLSGIMVQLGARWYSARNVE